MITVKTIGIKIETEVDFLICVPSETLNRIISV
jgi:hypothetical protein